MSSGYTQNLKFQCKAARLPEPEAEIRFHPTRRWRLDLGWRAQMLAVEVDGGTWIGGRHSRGKGYEADCEKLAEAAILGWKVIRVTTGQVKSGQALGFIERFFVASRGHDTGERGIQ